MNESTFDSETDRRIVLDIDETLSSIHVEGDYYYDSTGLKGLIENINNSSMIINVDPTPTEYIRINERRNKRFQDILQYPNTSTFFLIPYLKNMLNKFYNIKDEHKRMSQRHRQTQLRFQNLTDNIFKLRSNNEKLEEEILALKENYESTLKKKSVEILQLKNKLSIKEEKIKKKLNAKDKEIEKRKKMERKMQIVRESMI